MPAQPSSRSSELTSPAAPIDEGGEFEQPLSDVNVATVWNQIEAGMAYVHDHPLLVIVELGLKSEGLLETGYDWYVLRTKFDASEVLRHEFQGVFVDWKRRLGKKEGAASASSRAPAALEKLILGDLLSSLTVSQAWAVGTAITVLVGAVATLAYTIGTLFPK